MKKILKFILGFLVLVVVLLPLLNGELEVEDLNPKTRASLEGSFAELSDGYTHYELQGPEDAETIVLVHGNAAPYFTWDNNVDALVKAGFRVLRYDVYGHGFSDRPDRKAYNRDIYDRQLSELIKELEIKTPFYLAGTSQGGSICAYYTAQHPEQVEKLALLAPLFDEFEGGGMMSVVRCRFVGEYLMSVVGDKMLTNPSKVLYSDETQAELTEKLKKQIHYKGKKKAVLANMRGDALDDATVYYEEIKRQGIPVLLTWGENDRSIPKESMERLCQLIPDMEYHLIPEASHLAHYEFSEEINPLLIQFFERM